MMAEEDEFVGWVIVFAVLEYMGRCDLAAVECQNLRNDEHRIIAVSQCENQKGNKDQS
jgi:hypothetical protein